MQKVPGVDWVDVDIFGGISESVLQDQAALEDAVNLLGPDAQMYCARGTASQDNPTRAALWKRIYGAAPRFLPAQIAYLVPQVPRTLALNLSQQ